MSSAYLHVIADIYSKDWTAGLLLTESEEVKWYIHLKKQMVEISWIRKYIGTAFTCY